ncbi:DNA topoisomerase IV, alpha subunit [Phlegmacium glaucopus]|nr:DNA topoisomerase IV, alpha subunit [Phlegmacium glaucopus]
MPGGFKENKDSTEESDLENAHTSRAKRPKIEIRLADRKKIDNHGVSAVRCIRYPKKSKHGSAKPLAQLFKVLDLAHEATLNNLPATKRDIFYQDVALFKTQKVVDTLVDDLAATFELERSDLNIRSSSKGLICGSGLTITLISGESLIGHDTEGTLIPAGEDIESFSVDEDVAWILIVEKEAVFQTLCRLQLTKHDLMPGSGIIITGKGYPDVATRHIVKSLADALPRSVPVLGIVDADPYGLDILSVYKYGSKSMQHENDKLATARIKWLGLWASEVESFGIEKDGLLPITKHDEKKALTMLQKNARLPPRWKKELQYILHSRHKAEIEILSSKQSHSHEPFSGISCSTNSCRDDSMMWDQENICDYDGPDASGHTSPSYNPALLNSPTSAHLTSIASSSSSSFKPRHRPHVLLVRYLSLKVTNCVMLARRHGE